MCLNLHHLLSWLVKAMLCNISPSLALYLQARAMISRLAVIFLSFHSISYFLSLRLWLFFIPVISVNGFKCTNINNNLYSHTVCNYDDSPCSSEYREPSGRCTSTAPGRKTWGMAKTPFIRKLNPRYGEGEFWQGVISPWLSDYCCLYYCLLIYVYLICIFLGTVI